MILLKDVICDSLYADVAKIAKNSCFDGITGKSFLITGGSGFIAYYLAITLLAHNDCTQAGNKVFLLVRNAEKTRIRYGDLLKRDDVELIVQDVCQPISHEICVNYIIHAAGGADASQFEHNPIGVLQANTIGTNNILELASKCGSDSVVYVSSFTVYGSSIEREHRITEGYQGIVNWMDYKNCYSEGKRSGEMLCHCYKKQNETPVKIVRPGFVYGASTKDDPRVYAEIIREVASKENIVLQSSGLKYRSLCYVTNLVDGIFHTLFLGINGETYNIAGEHISIRQFAQAAIQAFPEDHLKVMFVHKEDENVQIPKEVFEMMDTTKIASLGWKSHVGTVEGIKMAATVQRENKC